MAKKIETPGGRYYGSAEIRDMAAKTKLDAKAAKAEKRSK